MDTEKEKVVALPKQRDSVEDSETNTVSPAEFLEQYLRETGH